MTKVAYNNCYGGFSLSREAVLLGRKISGDPKWNGTCIKGDVYDDDKHTVCNRDFGHLGNIPRSDPTLIAVIEQLGHRADGGRGASLAIEEVPEGTQYRIDEYDGNESVMTQESYDWETA